LVSNYIMNLKNLLH